MVLRKTSVVILGGMYVINMFHYIKQYYILTFILVFILCNLHFINVLFSSRESDNLVTYKHCKDVPLLRQFCKFVPNTVVHSCVLGLITNIC